MSMPATKGNDEIRDMATNYSIPRNVDIRGSTGIRFGTSWDNFTSATNSLQVADVIDENLSKDLQLKIALCPSSESLIYTGTIIVPPDSEL